jgi:hypothetical protein
MNWVKVGFGTILSLKNGIRMKKRITKMKNYR